MRESHQGAQEGQATFYWFQAVYFFIFLFFSLMTKTKKGETREAHTNKYHAWSPQFYEARHNPASVRNSSSVTGALGSTLLLCCSSHTAQTLMLLIDFCNLNPHLSDWGLDRVAPAAAQSYLKTKGLFSKPRLTCFNIHSVKYSKRKARGIVFHFSALAEACALTYALPHRIVMDGAYSLIQICRKAMFEWSSDCMNITL